jgi:hypothetical protein
MRLVAGCLHHGISLLNASNLAITLVPGEKPEPGGQRL